jgi:signal transduction histidine kinase
MKLDWCGLQEIVSHLVNDMKLLEQTSLSPSEFSVPATGNKMPEAEFALPPHLPRLVAEANGLKAVFENLFSNAMKYRRPETPLRVEVGWQEQPRFHAFWVRDNGMGMEPAFQQKAFNLFQRAPNGGKIAGTGVGLALVRRIIENHKGMIKLESKPGEGTSVYFTIPKLEQLKS